MLKTKRFLGVITARGGSKRIHEKNLKLINKKPLISWTIQEAKKSKYLDKVILSSENKKIISIAKKLNCEVPFVRPKKLAEDNAKSIDVLKHLLGKIKEKFDYLVLLQPTSPLRTAEDIDRAIRICFNINSPTCISVSKLKKNGKNKNILNIKNKFIPKNYKFFINGAVYIAKTDWILKGKDFLNKQTNIYIMPKSRSIDIDDNSDFKKAENLLKKI